MYLKKTISILLLFLFSGTLTAQEYAIQQLEDSPRHHEWVQLQSEGRTLHTFVAYPEVEGKAPVVMVIHENRGLNEWARSFADQLAGKGFIAIAPDLISNTVEGYERTSDFASSDEARSAIYALEPDQVTTDLNNVLKYAGSIPSGTGEVSVVGFCWGGSQSFRYATNAGDAINAAFVFYGTGPREKPAYANIAVPVYGFYGGDDNRVNATIALSKEAMEEFDNTYEYEIYEGAGHAYMRRGDDPDAAADDPNKKARDASWERLVNLLNNL